MTSLPRRASLGYQINHLGRLLGNGLRVNIADTGVTPGQFAQLLALYEQDGLTQQELCERVRIDQSTMAHTLNRMQRDGLVVRSTDPDDRRRSRYTLTERARAVQDTLTAGARAANARAVRGIPPEEMEAFMRTLQRMIANLESPG
ncbi:DNA-binding transcriptional regulator, MarR family [Nonomuraea solani]|uniref:DNA-binding transcriptional regulator, MarR family n=1 Tax=Nonomuraea solani TaxID=1144553 RepID=A0A1H6E267_9ACTN|nr:MarR family winged helix-turn-helix transcriptional regulator [Nonomuraea solani]SEG91682.1 DNA-binding transcriptional regulator, MarR family [Nonomuraea solani]